MGDSDVTSGSRAPADPYIGRTLDGRYLIKRVIGRGGMGAVYEAQHLGLDRRVALKFLLDTDGDPDAVARFRREARAASRIDHENVVDIFDVGTDNKTDFIAMEYVEGQDLRTILSQATVLPAGRAVEIARQMLEGLSAIHAAGIVHRDIKPGNVVVTSVTGREVVKIMDFGISKTHEPGLTAVGKVVGTPEYMAPEQRAGAATDHRTDLYAVGLTLYAMIAGHSPADAATAAMSPSGKRPKIPAEISKVLARALEFAPEARYASAKDFAAALVAAKDSADETRSEATVSDAPSSRRSAPPTTRTRASRWPMVAVGAVVMSAGIAVAVWQLTKQNGPAKAAPVVAPIAPVDAAAPDLVERARMAERDGKLDLAIARYVEAHESTRDPELLFRIGEIYERLDRTTDAVRYFERYRDEGPESGRSAATAKIARLTPQPVVDARVRTAAVVRKPPKTPNQESPGATPNQESPGATPNQGSAGATPNQESAGATPTANCNCVSVQPGKKGYWLCKTKHPPLCQCSLDGQVVCPTRLEECPDKKCPAHLIEFATHNGVMFGCSDRKVFQRLVPAKPGGACRGYSWRDLTSDPASATAAAERDATYDCDFCLPNAAARGDLHAKGLMWSGKSGDACKGVHFGDGETYPGRLECAAP